jgi:ParB family chromosome partitioning protein
VEHSSYIFCFLVSLDLKFPQLFSSPSPLPHSFPLPLLRKVLFTLSQRSNEWYTPSKFIEAAREVMGDIDLDPASCQLANETVKAKHYFTQEDDGLSQSWYGNVWLNPPFTGTHSREKWTKKALEEYRLGHVEQLVLLMPVATDTQWFRPLWSFLICFPSFRIHFYQGKAHHNSPNFGVCFIYLGPHEQKFIEVFSQIGTITRRISSPIPLVSQTTLL